MSITIIYLLEPSIFHWMCTFSALSFFLCCCCWLSRRRRRAWRSTTRLLLCTSCVMYGGRVRIFIRDTISNLCGLHPFVKTTMLCVGWVLARVAYIDYNMLIAVVWVSLPPLR